MALEPVKDKKNQSDYLSLSLSYHVSRHLVPLLITTGHTHLMAILYACIIKTAALYFVLVGDTWRFLFYLWCSTVAFSVADDLEKALSKCLEESPELACLYEKVDSQLEYTPSQLTLFYESMFAIYYFVTIKWLYGLLWWPLALLALSCVLYRLGSEEALVQDVLEGLFKERLIDTSDTFMLHQCLSGFVSDMKVLWGPLMIQVTLAIVTVGILSGPIWSLIIPAAMFTLYWMHESCTCSLD